MEASKSILATFRFDDKGYGLVIRGRGPSVVRGSKQGDHITAHGLVQRGFSRKFQGVVLDSEAGLSSLKEQRNEVYDFIDSVVALDIARKDNLHNGITSTLVTYNRRRFPKSGIESMEVLADREDTQITHEESKTLKIHAQKEKLGNAPIICETIAEIATKLLTFYNQVPNTAFNQIDGFEAPANEGATINSALNFLDDITKRESAVEELKSDLYTRQKDIKTQINNVTSSRQKDALSKQLTGVQSQLDRCVLENISSRISDLFFYPEISKKALKKHQAQYPDHHRDNSKSSLIDAMTKHLHITFAAYPELESDRFGGKESIIEEFMKNVITKPYLVRNPRNRRSNIEKDCGWPSFNSIDEFPDISQQVLINLKHLEKQSQSQDHKYTETEDYKTNVSSKNPSNRETRSASSEEEEKSSENGRRNSDEFQQQVISRISDDDFMKEFRRRLGRGKQVVDEGFFMRATNFLEISSRTEEEAKREAEYNRLLEGDEKNLLLGKLIELKGKFEEQTKEGYPLDNQDFNNNILLILPNIELQNIPEDGNLYSAIINYAVTNIIGRESFSKRDIVESLNQSCIKAQQAVLTNTQQHQERQGR